MRSITNTSIKKYIRQNCDGNVTKEFCQYKTRTNSVLIKKNKSNLKDIYQKSFSFSSNGTVDDVHYTILPSKNRIKGTVTRKFVGNVETNVIFTPEHRNSLD